MGSNMWYFLFWLDVILVNILFLRRNFIGFQLSVYYFTTLCIGWLLLYEQERYTAHEIGENPNMLRYIMNSYSRICVVIRLVIGTTLIFLCLVDHIYIFKLRLLSGCHKECVYQDV